MLTVPAYWDTTMLRVSTEDGGIIAGMRRVWFGAEILAVFLMASGVVVTSGEPSSAAESGSAASALPTWLHKTVDAHAYVAPASPFVSSTEPAGATVPGHDVTATVSDNGKLKFGLVTFPSSTQTYPAISTNGGMTWRVDGPLFHVDALQGASVVASSGVLPPHVSLASPKGPPSCQKHGTMSCPLRPALPMISEGVLSVKYVGADGLSEMSLLDPTRGLVSRAGGRTRLR